MKSLVVYIGEDLMRVGLKFGIPYKHTTTYIYIYISGGDFLSFIIGAQQHRATKPVCYIRMAS